MSSETQLPETTEPSTTSSVISLTENETAVKNDAKDFANVAENLEENLSGSNNPTSGETSVVSLSSSATTVAVKQYPKLNLRVNEFGIYELDTAEESSQSVVTTLTLSETKTEISETVANSNAAPVMLASAETVPPSTKPTETNSGTSASTTPSSSNVVSMSSNATTGTATSTTTSSNGDRERWKQRFPSNAMAKVDIVCCKQCDGYGIADEFVDENYCSEKCRKIGLAKPQGAKNREGSGAAGKVTAKRKSTSSNSSHHADSNMIVESSLDSCDSAKDGETKHSKPAFTATASWSWSKYLEKRRAQAAPERLFSDPFPYGKHGFRVGMKLEGIDPDHQSLFCVLTIAEVQGYRLRLHFDGYSDSHDFWLNADSENIFPCGWCEKNGQKLRPPKNWELPSNQTSSSPPPSNANQTAIVRTFSWPQYLKFTSSVAAPRHLFTSTRNEYPVPSAFRVKMKLEAVDRRHAAHSLCVATVANVIGSRFLVHFDGWDSIYDYWADPSCPYVHPVGWAQEHNTTLTPPCDYEETGEEFVWDTYMTRTGATAVPPRAFKPRSPVGFKTGMKLECVDPRNPQLIRVATVAVVKGYRLKIHFDGWSSDFDFWTDDDWPDLHPPGWCSKTGHPLQPPLMPTNGSMAKESGCPTPGCTGVGHVEGARYATHSSVDTCPYSGQNLHRESPAFPDRLAGEDVDSVPATLSPTGNANEGVSKDEVSRAAKTKVNVKVEPEVKDESAPPNESASMSSPSSSQKLEPDAKKTKFSPSAELSVKSEQEGEQNKTVPMEHRAESPTGDQNYDSTGALTPPPKKMRMSYFTGKVAASDSVKRKSIANEDKHHTIDSGSDPSSLERKNPEKAKTQNETADTSLSCSVQPKKSMHLDLNQQSPINTSLMTPFYWSKHSSLLANVVGSDTSIQAAQWTCDQVVEFLAKFSLNSLLLERFKLEEIDGEALISLSQSDLTDLLGVKLGPAIKIRNALLLMREKAKIASKAN